MKEELVASSTNEDLKVTEGLEELKRIDEASNQFLMRPFDADKKKYLRFVGAALSAIPWVGGVIGGIASLSAEFDQDKINQLLVSWIQAHKYKFEELQLTIEKITSRIDQLGDSVSSRIESPEYIQLVHRAFKSWDSAETLEKREMVSKLIANAASPISSDDVIRLFLKWFDQYDDSHFKVVGEIYKQKGITRLQIWNNLHDTIPSDDSAEADLFKRLIRDMSMGGVIRQERESNEYGQHLKAAKRKKAKAETMESAFEGTKGYELTEMGQQFVHYVMNDVVERIDAPKT